MTEKDIEKKVIDELSTAISNDDMQFVGAWQTEPDGLKSFQDYDSTAIVTVKTYPRTYETPTIPYASFQVDIALTMRAEIDVGGMSYLDVTQKISDKLQSWQNNFDSFKTTFDSIENFNPTGFNLDSGDVGLDRENCVWEYEHTFTLYGII